MFVHNSNFKNILNIGGGNKDRLDAKTTTINIVGLRDSEKKKRFAQHIFPLTIEYFSLENEYCVLIFLHVHT